METCSRDEKEFIYKGQERSDSWKKKEVHEKIFFFKIVRLTVYLYNDGETPGGS